MAEGAWGAHAARHVSGPPKRGSEAGLSRLVLPAHPVRPVMARRAAAGRRAERPAWSPSLSPPSHRPRCGQRPKAHARHPPAAGPWPLPEPRDRPVLPSGPAAAFRVHPRRTSSLPCTGRWDLHPESSASCAFPSVRSSFGAACDATSASRLRRACWGQGSPSGSLSLHWSSASFPERHGWPCSVCRPHPLSSNRLCELFAFESLGMSSRL